MLAYTLERVCNLSNELMKMDIKISTGSDKKGTTMIIASLIVKKDRKLWRSISVYLLEINSNLPNELG